jgi:hypothetical protein
MDGTERTEGEGVGCLNRIMDFLESPRMAPRVIVSYPVIVVGIGCVWDGDPVGVQSVVAGLGLGLAGSKPFDWVVDAGVDWAREGIGGLRERVESWVRYS